MTQHAAHVGATTLRIRRDDDTAAMRHIDTGDTLLVCGHGHYEHTTFAHAAADTFQLPHTEWTVVHSHARVNRRSKHQGGTEIGPDITADTAGAFPITLLMGDAPTRTGQHRQGPLRDTLRLPWQPLERQVWLSHLTDTWIATRYMPAVRDAGEQQGGSLVDYDLTVVPLWRLGEQATSGAVNGIPGRLVGTITWNISAHAVAAWTGPGLQRHPLGPGSSHYRVAQHIARDISIACVLDSWSDAIDLVDVVDMTPPPPRLTH